MLAAETCQNLQVKPLAHSQANPVLKVQKVKRGTWSEKNKDRKEMRYREANLFPQKLRQQSCCFFEA